MNDIVERLRSSVMWYSANAETVTEAAAEIERLRAALERIVDTDPDDGTAWFHNVARAALEGK
jgi:hypothetical protein